MRPAWRFVTISTLAVSLLLLVAGCELLLGYPGEEPDTVFPTTDVVVAAAAIAQEAVIEPEMLTLRAVPIDATNEMAFTDPTEAHGKVAAIDILQFQMITPNLLVDE